jgi:DNA-binding MarR family transcriptional regulator
LVAVTGPQPYSCVVSEIPLDQASGEVAAAAHDAARGKVVYLTEHGERLAAIVPAELAAELEKLTPEEFHDLLEDFADAQAAREALAEIEAGASPVPAEQVWAELGLDS